MYLITQHNGSYDCYEATPLFAVASEEEAKTVVELFRKYADWLNKERDQTHEFMSAWNEENPQTWRKDEPKKFGMYKDFWRRQKTCPKYREAYKITEETRERWEAIQKEQKDYEDRRDQWYKESREASEAFGKTLVCPDEFAKLQVKFGVSYNDCLSYTYNEIDILVLDDVK